MEYLIKSSAILAIFYLCYKLFLQRETFFTAHRWFLLIGFVASMLLPLVSIPIHVIKEAPQFIVNEWTNAGSTTVTETPFDYSLLIASAYLLVCLGLLVKLFMEFSSLTQLLFKPHNSEAKGYKHIETSRDIPPFSFFRYIVYNPHQFDTEELDQIIIHETIHAKQWHSIDLIIAKVYTVIFWFNPLTWLYKKELEQNLEYIADSETQRQVSCKKSYQYLLLKTVASEQQLALANPFYNSLIKKRIVMLHKSKSKKAKAWKYGLVLPVLGGFLMSFNTETIVTYTPVDPVITETTTPKANNVAITTPVTATSSNTPSTPATPVNQIVATPTNTTPVTANPVQDGKRVEMVVITKTTTNAELDALKDQYKQKGIKLKFKAIKRNSNNEITSIDIFAKTDHSEVSYNTNSSDAICDVKIEFDFDRQSVSIADAKKSNVFITSKGDHVVVSSDSKVKSSKVGSFHVYSTTETESESSDPNVIVMSNGENKVLKVTNAKNHVKVFNSDGSEANVWVSDDSDTEEDIIISNSSDADGSGMFFYSSEGDNPLFVINGKVVDKDAIVDLDPNNIASVNVLKGKAAKKKYGKKGENGVVEITLKKN